MKQANYNLLMENKIFAHGILAIKIQWHFLEKTIKIFKRKLQTSNFKDPYIIYIIGQLKINYLK